MARCTRGDHDDLWAGSDVLLSVAYSAHSFRGLRRFFGPRGTHRRLAFCESPRGSRTSACRVRLAALASLLGLFRLRNSALLSVPLVRAGAREAKIALAELPVKS